MIWGGDRAGRFWVDRGGGNVALAPHFLIGERLVLSREAPEIARIWSLSQEGFEREDGHVRPSQVGNREPHPAVRR